MLDARSTQTWVTRLLPALCHASLNPLLRTMPWFTCTLMRLLLEFARLPIEYLMFDTVYTAGWLGKKLTKLGLIWQGKLHPDTIVYWRNLRLPMWLLTSFLETRWWTWLGLRAVWAQLGSPTYGPITWVVTKNRHGNEEFLVTNSRTATVIAIVERQRSLSTVETVFRNSKQYVGLEGCQCWPGGAWVRYVGLVLLTFVVLQMLRQRPSAPLAAVKERWQLAMIRNGEQVPAPLSACSPELRPTA